jgi:hypothetical protein
VHRLRNEDAQNGMYSDSKGSVLERRGAMRFRLRLPVVFSWRDARDAVQGSEGYSRDLSSRGIYVQSELAPPAGASVEMYVLLPQPEYQIHPAELHTQGRVVRIEGPPASSQPFGFAAMNHTIMLRDSHAHAVSKADDDVAENAGTAERKSKLGARRTNRARQKMSRKPAAF